ncbi:MAG TPA: biopolymer transporter ExbD [Nevskiaceae bacterium]|nr:biopolymer transporter ExbD [Nevskiaceae bacterium]
MQLERKPRARGTHLIITSLVDVMLVLLFYFILTAGYGKAPRELALSLAAPVAAHGSSGTLHEVRMRAPGDFLLDGAPLPLAEIQARMHGAQLALRPAPQVQLQALLDALAALRKGGAQVELGT